MYENAFLTATVLLIGQQCPTGIRSATSGRQGALRRIVCQRCGDVIESKSELVTTLSLLQGIMPYHLDCHAQNQKGWNAGATPINSQATIAIMIIGLIVCTVLLVIIKSWVFVVAGLLAPLLRLLSWLIYERFLP
ncbi:hypothetical protein AN477_13670 [Alicyclobacillus ferrooxydans]|uniref:Uncharacterized protein n=1 Tax=Alicyclobacillus ferrooxydans TaxID=471514 RepID=A0A0P9CCL0_9BACL|nr:hypothetical protein AN477_13670 [Alicyclobacillus ferrooxydans]